MNDVKVVISLSKASPRAGFGMPLIVGCNMDKQVPYTVVSSLDEIVTAGIAKAERVYKAAEILFMQDNAPSKIAVCTVEAEAGTFSASEHLAPILHEDWRQLIVVDIEVMTAIETATYIESCGEKKLFFNGYWEEAEAEGFSQYERTVNCITTDTAAALVGATAGLDAGSFTYKNIVLKGVTALNLTAEELANNEGAILAVKKAGEVVTSDGIVGSGEYIDIIDTQDYIIEQIEYQSQSLMNRVPKLHFDDRGISALESVVVSVLKDAADKGMIAQTEDGDYEYSVTFLPRAECSATDISARHYTGGSFEFTLAGAIHTAKITGQIIA